MYPQKSQVINLLSKVCFDVSRNLLRDFHELNFLKRHVKVEQFVGRTVERSFEKIKDFLENSNSGHGFMLNDEVIKDSSTNLYWMINPIDSIENFSHRLPLFGVAIALVEGEDAANAIAGVYLDPIRNELFAAQQDQGVFLNSRKLRVNYMVESPMMAYQDAGAIKKYGNLRSEAGKNIAGRHFGSTVLHMAYIAANRLDGAQGEIDSITNFLVGKLFIEEAKGSIVRTGDEFFATAFA